MYPVAVNMGISRDVEINGEADPQKMQIKGEVRLVSGVGSCIGRSNPLLFTWGPLLPGMGPFTIYDLIEEGCAWQCAAL